MMHSYFPSTENAFIKAAVAFFHFAFLSFILLVISGTVWTSFEHVLRHICAVNLVGHPGEETVKNCSIPHQNMDHLDLIIYCFGSTVVLTRKN